MINRHRRIVGLQLLFALSGFAGLIYQAIWTHYLGLTLGHAAYAQTLVLAIFMGGMAAGSWWVSRRGGRWQNLILIYAIVEAIIGVLGLAFHPVFVAYTGWSQDTVLPTLAAQSVPYYQWLSAAALILPQTLLLGTTFPLMAAGCLRLDQDPLGKTLGGLYFTNSLGAASGALVATFLLLPSIGMPGAMLVAGVLNLVVAAGAWRLAGGGGLPTAASSVDASAVSAEAPRGSGRFLALVLVAAGITGATSFVYEIVWVRMLNQALGTTLHSFELMLATFILGLACGAFWIHRRGDRIENVMRYAGFAQVAMGAAALLSLVFFSNSFRWIAWLMAHLARDSAGYAWFNLGSAAIAMLVMFPAAFFAGMTLPLFTMALLRRQAGEASIGRIYAANTVGAIAGVFLTVHVLVPAMGLGLSLTVSALADIVLGVVLLRRFGVAETSMRDLKVAVAASIAMFAVASFFGRPDPLAQASGVFRSGKLKASATARVEYLADGKTSTVSILGFKDSSYAIIATNGKPDAGMMRDTREPAGSDEVTMVMLGTLPLVLHEAPRDVALIGWGSGLSAHTILGSDAVRHVDSIEIEPAMYEGAKFFGSRAARAYTDPRSNVVFEDARTYFSAGNKKYDVIVSEPSNPWVSGVASLFTEEFYAFTRRHLNDRGLMVQWLHTYEINDALLTRMVAALTKEYPYCEVFLTNDFDLVLVASGTPLNAVDTDAITGSALRAETDRVGLGSTIAYDMRRIGDQRLLATYARLFGSEGNSDFYPVIGLEAPKERFLGSFAFFLQRLVMNGAPLLDLLQGRMPPRRKDVPPNNEEFMFLKSQRIGWELAETVTAADGKAAHAPKKSIARMSALRQRSSATVASADLPKWTADTAFLAAATVGILHPDDLRDLWLEPTWLGPGQPREVSMVMAAYRAAAERDAPAMATTAKAVLALPAASVAPELRVQMVIYAMLAAANQGDFAEVYALSDRYADLLASAGSDGEIASFLLAWSEKAP